MPAKRAQFGLHRGSGPPRFSCLALDEAITLARDSGSLIIALCVVSDTPRIADVDSGYIDQR
ncbi:hypothetical protein DN563_27415, partial [Burkholderia multivorans]